MDFIEGLLSSNDHNTIVVLVDRYQKYDHCMVLGHPFIAQQVAQVFMNEVFKLHGVLKNIVSDRDPLFLNSFWKSFFTLQGFTLNYSSFYHLQSDGQLKILNKCLETYLRCYTGTEPKFWSNWLVLAKWWCSTQPSRCPSLKPCMAMHHHSCEP